MVSGRRPFLCINTYFYKNTEKRKIFEMNDEEKNEKQIILKVPFRGEKGEVMIKAPSTEQYIRNISKL